jgi:hypothetical protein
MFDRNGCKKSAGKAATVLIRNDPHGRERNSHRLAPGSSARLRQRIRRQSWASDIRRIPSINAVGATRFGAADSSALARRRKAHDGHIDVNQPNRR